MSFTVCPGADASSRTPLLRRPGGTRVVWACGTCDRRERIGEADRLFLRKILSGVARAPRPFGRRKIAAMLVGHTEGLPVELTRLSTTGLLRDNPPRLIEQWIESACAVGLIVMSADRSRRSRDAARSGRDGGPCRGRTDARARTGAQDRHSDWRRMPRRSRR